MKNKNNVTELTRHAQKKVTLTTYASFVLTPAKRKLSFIRSCRAEIKYQPYWADIRNGIARVHNSETPNIKELTMLIPCQNKYKKINYQTAVRGYITALSAGSIVGKKEKRYKTNVHYDSLTLRLNPELHLSSEDGNLVIKLHISKNLRMTQNVANQMIAIMDQEFATLKPTKYLIVDVNAGAVFGKVFTGQDYLEEVALNCQRYSDFDQSDQNQELAA